MFIDKSEVYKCIQQTSITRILLLLASGISQRFSCFQLILPLYCVSAPYLNLLRVLEIHVMTLDLPSVWSSRNLVICHKGRVVLDDLREQLAFPVGLCRLDADQAFGANTAE